MPVTNTYGEVIVKKVYKINIYIEHIANYNYISN